jgi:molecular chaperone GrpE
MMPMSRKKSSTEAEAAGQTVQPVPSMAPPEAASPGRTDRELKALLDESCKKLAESQARADGNLALLQRVAADYENFKKFADRERAEAVLRERSAMLVDFIDSCENLERAIEAGCKELGPDSKLLKGLRLTLDLMKAVLDRAGVKPIAASGSQFDPTLHEAVYFVLDPSKPEYSIAEEIRRGYTLNGKVLRTSKVCVVTRPATEKPAGPECPKDDKKEA